MNTPLLVLRIDSAPRLNGFCDASSFPVIRDLACTRGVSYRVKAFSMDERPLKCGEIAIGVMMGWTIGGIAVVSV